jgi:predicted  nucleic acid-binding Zn-ribbon protein
MQIPPQIQLFNQRIKQLNHSVSNGMQLSTKEARNLHSEIFTLIAHIADLQDQLIQMQSAQQGDGGKW